MKTNVPNAPQLPDDRPVSTAQVAQMLGVSVTTVKRWVDDGVIPAYRTAGGHRKLLLADVLRMTRESGLPSIDPRRLQPQGVSAPADTEAISRQLLAAAQARDAEAMRLIIHRARQSGLPIAVIADRVLAPVMVRVGEDWAAGRIDVSHEHLITQACLAALYELDATLASAAAKDGPIAVGGAPENDHTLLPSLLARMTLMDCGWKAINLGPHTPMSAFHQAVEELAPRLVWITSSHPIDEMRFLKEYAEFYRLAERRGIAVAIGGRGMTERLRCKMEYTTYGDGLMQLAAFARTLNPRPSQPKRGRPRKDR